MGKGFTALSLCPDIVIHWVGEKMATVFYTPDSLSLAVTDKGRSWNKTRQFESMEQAQVWADSCKAKSRWFSCFHISPLNVEEIPLCLITSRGSGEYMITLSIVKESQLKGVEFIAYAKEEWGLRCCNIAALSSGGSLFSTFANNPTYIDVFKPGWEEVAYILLGGCQRPIPGISMEICEELLSLKPKDQKPFSGEEELHSLKYPPSNKLITKKMKERVEELKLLKEQENEKYNSWRVSAYVDWYKLILSKCGK